MESREDRLNRSLLWTIVLSLISVSVLAGILVFFVPLIRCPDCDGAGAVQAVDTRDENWKKKPRKYAPVPCWECRGSSRITAYRRWNWQPSTLSDK
jgi:hypothetical protein